MDSKLKKIEAVFYELPSGNEPVREWLKDLSDRDKKIIGRDIAMAEYGWPIGMPTCKSLKGGLYEIRSDLSSNRIARVIFCIYAGKMVLLHGFIKKTQKIEDADLELARKRKREIE